MLTLGTLRENLALLDRYRGIDFLASVPAGSGEVLVRNPAAEADVGPPATMVFMHETIAMMKAERAEPGGF